MRKLLLVVAALAIQPGFSADLLSPEDFLGFRPGEARHLADYNQIIDYYKLLARSYDRISIDQIGRTIAGKPLYVVNISSPQNLNHLPAFKAIQDKLIDPRNTSEAELPDLFRQGKLIVALNCGIHSNEIGPTQMSLNLAYQLASDNSNRIQSILENIVMFLLPVQNPDGHTLVVDWYRKYLNSEFEGSDMPWLYHKYAGHDLNRDWFMLTQAETRLTVEKIYNVWHPHIVLDMHQMDQYAARQFVPPYSLPIDPFIDPLLLQEIKRLGDSIVDHFNRAGKPGIVNAAYFDAWSPARAYPFYHHGIRFLSETASCQIASPVPLHPKQLEKTNKIFRSREAAGRYVPWQDATWDLAQIVDYSQTVAFCLLEYVAGHRRRWLEQFWQISKNAVQADQKPFAFLILDDIDNYAANRRITRLLMQGTVEVHCATDSFHVEGTSYPAGTFIIYCAQPFGAYAKTLLSNTPYPEALNADGVLRTTYDITTHFLPGFLGTRVVPIEKGFQARSRLLENVPLHANTPDSTVKPIAYAILPRNPAYKLVNTMFGSDHPIYWLNQGANLSHARIPTGSFLITAQNEFRAFVEKSGTGGWIQLMPIRKPITVTAHRLRRPRIGLYRSWVASMDEGWTRWLFDEYRFSFVSLSNQDIRKGELNKQFDVIILPDQTAKTILNGHKAGSLPRKFCGGLGKTGMNQLQSFVINGGTLITLDSSSEIIARHFNVGLEIINSNWQRRDFYAPGSLFNIKLDTAHPVCYGYPERTAVLFRNSPVFRVRQGHVIGRYDHQTAPCSGMAHGFENLRGFSAIVELNSGAGKIICFGCRPQFRAQIEATFMLLFNAIYASSLGTAERVTCN
ncbi:hypothetical protein JXJ21_04375 [candidate division KSB1 bacterium]|nr:hypothetical protein [candidate division KSB1 bacterium]